MKEKNKTALC